MQFLVGEHWHSCWLLKASEVTNIFLVSRAYQPFQHHCLLGLPRLSILTRRRAFEGCSRTGQGQLVPCLSEHWLRAFSSLTSLKMRVWSGDPYSNKEWGWRESRAEPASSTNGKTSFCEVREKSLRRAGRLTTEWTQLTGLLSAWLSFWHISWPT